MREIKFRAWDNHNMVMTGVYTVNKDKLPENNKHYQFMQFTGLLDKNGKEIYHGDINQDKGVVIWNEDDASFCWEYKELETMSMGEESDWCEIIGNIYENPELIK